MTIYIVRHAQTEANKFGIIQGQQNTEITEEGLNGAEAMASFFKSIKVTKMFVSPIKRTMITAELIAVQSNFPIERIEKVPALKEINLLPWTFKKISELDRSDLLSSYKTYKEQPSKFVPDSGESIWDVRKRTSLAFDRIVSRCSEDDIIVVVSHSMAIRTMLTYIEEKSIDSVWEYDIPPVSITKVTLMEGKTNIEYIGKNTYK